VRKASGPAASPLPPRASPPRRKNARTGEGGEPPISPLTINRLSLYLRSLRQLEAVGVARVSSSALARFCQLSAAQVRKDLAAFGDFGTRGVGYDIAPLVGSLAEVLHLDRTHRIVIFGMGNIGRALASYPAFNSASFRVVAGFDSDPEKVGRRVGDVRIHSPSDVARVVRRARATMAVLAVPAEAATTGFEALSQAGITAILNLAPFILPSTAGCRVKNVDLRAHLEELSYFGAP
jgi:redox-sensing transcriptional repressor